MHELDETTALALRDLYVDELAKGTKRGTQRGLRDGIVQTADKDRGVLRAVDCSGGEGVGGRGLAEGQEQASKRRARILPYSTGHR